MSQQLQHALLAHAVHSLCIVDGALVLKASARMHVACHAEV
jgi:hypothetical protein